MSGKKAGKNSKGLIMFMLAAMDEEEEKRAASRIPYPTTFARRLGWMHMTNLLQDAREAGYNTVKEFLKDNITVEQYKLLTEQERNLIFPDCKG